MTLFDRNSGIDLMDSETFGPFGKEFKAALTRPKILVGNEREEDVPAMQLVKDIRAKQKAHKESLKQAEE